MPDISIRKDGKNSSFRISERYRWYVVWLVFAAYVLNFDGWQTRIVLMEPIRPEFAFQDTGLGLPGGPNA